MQKKAKTTLQKHHIEHSFSLVHHSEINDQVELDNKIILSGLKKRVNVLRGNYEPGYLGVYGKLQ